MAAVAASAAQPAPPRPLRPAPHESHPANMAPRRYTGPGGLLDLLLVAWGLNATAISMGIKRSSVFRPLQSTGAHGVFTSTDDYKTVIVEQGKPPSDELHRACT